MIIYLVSVPPSSTHHWHQKVWSCILKNNIQQDLDIWTGQIIPIYTLYYLCLQLWCAVRSCKNELCVPWETLATICGAVGWRRIGRDRWVVGKRGLLCWSAPAGLCHREDWFQSLAQKLFQVQAGMHTGIWVLYWLMGGGLRSSISTGWIYSQRCALTRMLVKIDILPECISSVAKEVII